MPSLMPKYKMRSLLTLSASILLFSVELVLGVQYGPSLSSLTGVYLNWKGPDLLAIESGRKVMLENYPGLSATLPLISGDSKATSEQIFKERGISTVGEFIVEAPKGFGIIVVIQELKLRKINRERGNPNATIQCSDYIQFGDLIPEVNGVNAKTNKICGTILRDDSSVSPPGLLGSRTFRSSSGRVRVALNHAYVAELVDNILGSRSKPILRAEVTFTAYHGECSIVETHSSNTTSPTEQESVEYESFDYCTDYTKTPELMCISSRLLCDDIYNCGGDGDSLGSDESVSSCPDKPLRTTELIGQDESLNVNGEDKQGGGLTDLVSYLGIPALSSYQSTADNKKYERRFRPSYVSSQQSSGSGFLYDYTSKRTSEHYQSSSSTTEASSSSGGVVGGSIEINVIGPRESKSSNILNNEISQDDIETEIYSRRELSHAINSVIYGVLVFIVFTIIITVFIVCLTKKIQMSWTARVERRNSEFDPQHPNRRRVSTPAIIPNNISVLSVSRRSSDCDPGSISINTRGIEAPIDIDIGDLPAAPAPSSDLPPSYDTLFPVPRT